MTTHVSGITPTGDMLHRLDLVVAEDDFALAEALVAQHASSGWEEESLVSGETRLRVHSRELADLDALESMTRSMLPSATLRREDVPDQNWLDAWREFFTPVEAGEFLILPPWLAKAEEKVAACAKGLLPVIIEPKSAFGTGHHPTTTLCLTAISRLYRAGKIHQGQRFLDLGTGTGVLGIGCVKLGLQGLGVDIDPLAVSNAADNRAINQVGEAFEVLSGSVEAVHGQLFDLVIANILAAPLKEMASRIMPLVKPGGCLILSGFLTVQTAGLKTAYAAMTGCPGRLIAASASSDPTRTSTPADSNGFNGVDDWVCLMWPNA